MRILFPTTEFPPCPGGVATLALEQARGLADLGHPLWVETPESPGRKVESTGRLHIRYLRIQARAIVRLVPLVGHLWQAGRRFRPDFICCPTYRGYGLPVQLLARLQGIPYCIYVHGTEVRTEVRSRARRAAIRSVLAGASFIAVNSENTRALVLGHFPKLDGRVVVVHPGVDVSKFQDPEAERRGQAVRQQWLEALGQGQLPRDPVVFLSLCRLTRQKGIDLVLRALAELVAADPTFAGVCVVAGNGPDAAEFRALAETLGVSSRVLFAGSVPYEDTPAVFRGADVYVQPSQPFGRIVESFGISFLEAQAAGLPCIGTDWGGIPEAVEQDKTALLVATNSVRAIAEAMRAMAVNSDLRQKMAYEALQHARRFSWTTHAERMYERAASAVAKSSRG